MILKSEQEAHEKLSALAKVKMPEQKQLEIKEAIASRIAKSRPAKSRPVAKHRRTGVWGTGAAVAAALVIAAGGLYSVSNVRSHSSSHIQQTVGSQHLSFSGEQAIAKVNPVLGTQFPSTPSIVHGKIGVGGPAPGRVIPAILQTQVQQINSNTYYVIFTEQWSSKDFVGNESTAKSVLKHYWKYKVSPSGYTVVAQGGDFPPQDAR